MPECNQGAPWDAIKVDCHRGARESERITVCRGGAHPIRRSGRRIWPIGIFVRISGQSGVILVPLGELVLRGVRQTESLPKGLLVLVSVTAQYPEVAVALGGELAPTIGTIAPVCAAPAILPAWARSDCPGSEVPVETPDSALS